jgi:cytoskeletal protein CcmA (bactofilin family)
MAANATVIGRTTRVRGRLSGDVDLTIEGFVEGEIAVTGNVTVDTHGMVGANVQGRRLTVRGAIRGDLVGGEAVVLEEGARVVGDVRAPRIAIAQGALMRGLVQTGDDGAAQAPAVRAHQLAKLAKPAAATSRAAAAPPALAPAPAKAAAAVKPAAAALPAPPSPHRGNSSGARRPPPPIVPALKKMKGQLLKKREH